MDISNVSLTPSFKKAVGQLLVFSKSLKHSTCNSYHLFYLCWANSNKQFLNFLTDAGVNLSTEKLESLIIKFSKKHSKLFSVSGNPDAVQEVEKSVQAAIELAQKNDHFFAGTEHYILSFLESNEEFSDFLLINDIDTEYLKTMILGFICGGNPKNISGFDPSFEDEDEEEDEEDQEKDSSIAKTAIEKFCVYLNDVVSQPFYQKITGREKEIRQTEEALCRKLKSNCVLVGEAGTGKTAIVEGLAQMITSESYQGPLKDSKVYSLDFSSLLAGTKYRGQLEERFRLLLKELIDDKNSILFVDEIHTIVGAGGREGSYDLANMLKPALARGDIRCIGATTYAEYKKFFEKDSALSRRFHKIAVSEPSSEETFYMLKKSLPSYEEYHKLKAYPKIAELIIKLCETYLPNQRFPDKAFDVLDLSAAKAKINNKSKTNKISKDDVYAVISDKTGVESSAIRDDINKGFCSFKESMKKKVFGQDEVISKIYDSLLRAKVGLNEKNKPMASFFFVGPSGVGKTFTAKNVAQDFFGNAHSFLHLNMAEYKDSSSIPKLIGASAGYIGFDNGGILTEFARNNPNGLILFDNIENCHFSALNLITQILDQGFLKDNLNRDINFSRSIIIFTSNNGSSNNKKAIGFGTSNMSERPQIEDVKQKLPQEIVSRVDEVLLFHRLNEDALKRIFNLRIQEIQSRLQDKKIKIKCDESAQKFLFEKLASDAREINNLIKLKIEAPLSQFIVLNPKKRSITIKALDKELILE